MVLRSPRLLHLHQVRATTVPCSETAWECRLRMIVDIQGVVDLYTGHCSSIYIIYISM